MKAGRRRGAGDRLRRLDTRGSRGRGGAGGRAFGRLDFAFNNAGVENKAPPLHEIELEEWDRILGINLRGTFVCMKHEIAQMLNQGGGVVVNTSSGRRHPRRGRRQRLRRLEACDHRHDQIGRARLRQVEHPRERGPARQYRDADDGPLHGRRHPEGDRPGAGRPAGQAGRDCGGRAVDVLRPRRLRDRGLRSWSMAAGRYRRSVDDGSDHTSGETAVHATFQIAAAALAFLSMNPPWLKNASGFRQTGETSRPSWPTTTRRVRWSRCCRSRSRCATTSARKRPATCLRLARGRAPTGFSTGTLGLWSSNHFVIYYRDGRVPQPGIILLGRAVGDVSIFDRPGPVTVRIERVR